MKTIEEATMPKMFKLTPVTLPALAELRVALELLKNDLSIVGKRNLMRLYDMASGEPEKIDYRVFNQWLVFAPEDAKGEVRAIFGERVKWELDIADHASFDSELNQIVADASMLHNVLVDIEYYLKMYAGEAEFQKDVKAGKKAYFSTNFADADVRIAMGQYKNIHGQLEKTQGLLTNYFTKLIQTNSDTVPASISDLRFNHNWSGQDELRIANIIKTHKLVANSLAQNVDIQAATVARSFCPT
jgi:hypothetical protein